LKAAIPVRIIEVPKEEVVRYVPIAQQARVPRGVVKRRGTGRMKALFGLGRRVPREGEPAPDFALGDGNGAIHRLEDYRGRWLVLYFYPKDNTPGCTREACEFRDGMEALDRAQAAVVGISLDPPRRHLAFAAQYGLPFTLLSDPRGRVAASYGSLVSLGIVRFARRRTFIIDPEGRVARVFRQVSPRNHADAVIEALRELAS
jgi:peroxiredoxin Q/BCP